MTIPSAGNSVAYAGLRPSHLVSQSRLVWSTWRQRQKRVAQLALTRLEKLTNVELPRA